MNDADRATGRVRAQRRPDAAARHPSQPRRLKLSIPYEVTTLPAWESHSHCRTVRDHLDRALERVTGAGARVHGAGRTDAKAPALAQCAEVDISNKPLSV